jgi:hypothetical protein
MFQTLLAKPLGTDRIAALVSSLWHSSFGLLSDFVFRLSNFKDALTIEARGASPTRFSLTRDLDIEPRWCKNKGIQLPVDSPMLSAFGRRRRSAACGFP